MGKTLKNKWLLVLLSVFLFAIGLFLVLKNGTNVKKTYADTIPEGAVLYTAADAGTEYDIADLNFQTIDRNNLRYSSGHTQTGGNACLIMVDNGGNNDTVLLVGKPASLSFRVNFDAIKALGYANQGYLGFTCDARCLNLYNNGLVLAVRDSSDINTVINFNKTYTGIHSVKLDYSFVREDNAEHTILGALATVTIDDEVYSGYLNSTAWNIEGGFAKDGIVALEIRTKDTTTIWSSNHIQPSGTTLYTAADAGTVYDISDLKFLGTLGYITADRFRYEPGYVTTGDQCDIMSSDGATNDTTSLKGKPVSLSFRINFDAIKYIGYENQGSFCLTFDARCIHIYNNGFVFSVRDVADCNVNMYYGKTYTGIHEVTVDYAFLRDGSDEIVGAKATVTIDNETYYAINLSKTYGQENLGFLQKDGIIALDIRTKDTTTVWSSNHIQPSGTTLYTASAANTYDVADLTFDGISQSTLQSAVGYNCAGNECRILMNGASYDTDKLVGKPAQLTLRVNFDAIKSIGYANQGFLGFTCDARCINIFNNGFVFAARDVADRNVNMYYGKTYTGVHTVTINYAFLRDGSGAAVGAKATVTIDGSESYYAINLSTAWGTDFDEGGSGTKEVFAKDGIVALEIRTKSPTTIWSAEQADAFTFDSLDYWGFSDLDYHSTGSVTINDGAWTKEGIYATPHSAAYRTSGSVDMLIDFSTFTASTCLRFNVDVFAAVIYRDRIELDRWLGERDTIIKTFYYGETYSGVERISVYTRYDDNNAPNRIVLVRFGGITYHYYGGFSALQGYPCGLTAYDGNVRLTSTTKMITINGDNRVVTYGDTVALEKQSRTGYVHAGWVSGDAIYSPTYSFTYDGVSSYNFEPLFVELYMINGAWIRCTSEVTGIKFASFLGDTDIDELSGKISSFGIIILPKDLIDGDLTVNSDTVRKINFTFDSGHKYASITNIKYANYNREFSARSFIQIDFADGTDYVYTDIVTRSVYKVALKVMEQEDDDDVINASSSFINGVIDLDLVNPTKKAERTYNTGYTVNSITENSTNNFTARVSTRNATIKALAINGITVRNGMSFGGISFSNVSITYDGTEGTEGYNITFSLGYSDNTGALAYLNALPSSSEVDDAITAVNNADTAGEILSILGPISESVAA